ncbi:MAG: hypothetical protein GY696_18060 [Gammaproteobacteria bacterium]|nr:hypothetical protein [Gammaproteobacteria bacterium]
MEGTADLIETHLNRQGFHTADFQSDLGLSRSQMSDLIQRLEWRNGMGIEALENNVAILRLRNVAEGRLLHELAGRIQWLKREQNRARDEQLQHHAQEILRLDPSARIHMSGMGGDREDKKAGSE